MVIMESTQAMKDDCQRDLEVALPALRSAEDAVSKLNKEAITEVKSFRNPPEVVVLVMMAVCFLKDQKQDWDSALRMLSDTNFRASLINYPKDDIPAAKLRKLKTWIENPDFEIEKVSRVSKAATAMCMWVRAIDTYAHVAKTVGEPIICFFSLCQEPITHAVLLASPQA